MNVQEAIAAAQDYVNEVYAGEGVCDLALEETEHDEVTGKWLITLAFSRPWNTPRTRTQEVLETVGGFVTPLKRA